MEPMFTEEEISYITEVLYSSFKKLRRPFEPDFRILALKGLSRCYELMLRNGLVESSQPQ